MRAEEMEWTIDYLEEDRIVSARVSGIMTWDDTRDLPKKYILSHRSRARTRFS